MSDLTPSDGLLTLTEIASRIPGARGAKRLHPATITRWILRGTRGVDGTVVRLKATRIGFRWLVKAADLEDFFNSLSLTSGSPPVPPAVRSPAARQKASERAAEKLKDMGA